jgi:hypothetical protein
MALHTKVADEGLDGRYLSVNPLLGDEKVIVPKHRLPDGHSDLRLRRHRRARSVRAHNRRQ